MLKPAEPFHIDYGHMRAHVAYDAFDNFKYKFDVSNAHTGITIISGAQATCLSDLLSVLIAFESYSEKKE